ncbi:hypothetical protein MPTK1_4g13910 [Marchantia polymorpha subsp. ruderalis]|uniref:Cathepsin propeptide inhibitor domain-containing protein n=4 Tax=Marchantia polymorpha TaxID=3197 RepID=A0AAF6B9P0_MARPO|nr:hypothetical protein MARPO_0070s0090 [Marchantia polymorpha]BBN08724.1 hypothetical protein Mp_4g13910 [Marchantia polymorpha subsp. ruderalis]|eukprot:PTQ35629.1 hypothetical protein MARPO_0070s0090 [Marchantia polymorpha]
MFLVHICSKSYILTTSLAGAATTSLFLEGFTMGRSVLPFVVVITLMTVCLTVHGAASRELKGEPSPKAPDFPSKTEMQSLFDEWMKKYSKTYASDADKTARFKNFEENFMRASEHNRKQSTYKMTMNQFADLSPEEFVKKQLMHLSPRVASTRHPTPYKDVEEQHKGKTSRKKGPRMLSAVYSPCGGDNPGDRSCKH